MRTLLIYLRIFIGTPLSIFYIMGTELRRVLYRTLLKVTTIDAVVISVGNITSGGTGKTPFVNELVAYFRKQGKKVAIVSRSYRGSATEPQKVDLKNENAAAVYGDEPVLLARKNPDIAVWVGPKKSETSLEVARKERPDVIIIDDGFQHLKLKRDYDFVLVDATEPFWHYLPIPAGYARDAVWRLDGADLIVITKQNLATEREKDRVVALVDDPLRTVKMNYTFRCLRNIKTQEMVDVHDLKHFSRVLLVSGIGRPHTFESLVQRETHFTVAYHKTFPDHHQFADSDREKIESLAQEHQAEAILLTEKDTVRLKEPFSLPTFAVMLKVDIVGLNERLHELFH